MTAEPPGTTVGNLNQKVAQLEAALASEPRYLCFFFTEVFNGVVQPPVLKMGWEGGGGGSMCTDCLPSTAMFPI